jgi:hypothetical protein
LGPNRGGVGDPGALGQLVFGDLRKRRGTRFGPQVADVVEGEGEAGSYDGLTPVTITL